MIAEIIIFNGPPHPLSYRADCQMVSRLAVGQRVIVPLGHRKAVGIVFSLSDDDNGKLKPIADVLDHTPLIDKTRLELLRWISSYYHASLRDTISLFIPRLLSKPDSLTVYAMVEKDFDTSSLDLENSSLEILGYIISRQKVKLSTVKSKYERKDFYHCLSALELAGLIKIGYKSRPEKESELKQFDEQFMQTQEVMLNDEQMLAYNKIEPFIISDKFQPFLLYGVTGSGKSEVYLKLIWQALSNNKSALILLPEIVSTEEIYQKIQKRLGNVVCRIHSGLKPAERLAIWEQIRQGKYRVIIGPRSALFAPIKNLGIIFVDEEHDSSYKQSGAQPGYHGRDLALILGKLSGCPVILGSATPSVESWYNAKMGKYQLLRLKSRWDNRALPQIHPVQFVFTATGSTLSDQLLAGMRKVLKAEGQIMLLLNRRGFAPTVKCGECGSALKCPNCSVGLVYHQTDKSLKCHFCEYTSPEVLSCPKCSGSSFLHFGVGTQRLEEEIKTAFPKVPFARVDLDSISQKNKMTDILDDFRNGKLRILIGTQMIAKAFDFPEVALMGILSADSYLDFPDFRSQEKTLAMLLQASGRAGRGKFTGHVVIQYSEDYQEFIENLSEDHIEEFLENELKSRKALDYPPYKHLIMINIKAAQAAKGGAIVSRLSQLFDSHLNNYSNVFKLMGPVEAPLFKVRNNYRWQFLIKTGAVFKTLEILDYILSSEYARKLTADLNLSFDVDPVDML